MAVRISKEKEKLSELPTKPSMKIVELVPEEPMDPIEPVMADDEIMLPGRLYIVDGEILRSAKKISVREFREALCASEIKVCDYKARRIL